MKHRLFLPDLFEVYIKPSLAEKSGKTTRPVPASFRSPGLGESGHKIRHLGKVTKPGSPDPAPCTNPCTTVSSLLMMSSLPVVWCFSNATHPTPTSSHILRLYAEHFTSDFILLDQVPVTKMSEKEREHVQGILCTGGFTKSKVIVGKEIMDLLPNLKVISTPSTGVNHIDVEAASACGIRVGHGPGHFVSDCVAEFAFGLLLASARTIIDADKSAKSLDITSLELTVGGTARSATRTCVMKLDTLGNVSPRGGRSGTPTGFVIKVAYLGWDFDKSVFPKGQEDCQH